MKSSFGPFSLKVSTLRSDYSVVVNAQGAALKTHLQGEFIPWPTDVAQLLANDLNALPQHADLRESLVYCLLSTFCEEKQPQFELFVEDDLFSKCKVSLYLFLTLNWYKIGKTKYF